jgi:hypothetical protein
MSAIIETHTRGSFTVLETPRDARMIAQSATITGRRARYLTPAGQVVTLHHHDIKRIRDPGTMRPWARKTAGWLALLLVCFPLLIAGTALIALGAFGAWGAVFGQSDEINVSGWLLLPGVCAWYLSGFIGVHAADTIGL